MYNAKNYTEQGGDVTHIGGKIVYDNGLMENMSTAAVDSDTVAKVRGSLNTLITELKDAGLMVADDLTITVANSVVDPETGHTNRTYNTGKISNVAESDGVITITAGATSMLGKIIMTVTDNDGTQYSQPLGVVISGKATAVKSVKAADGEVVKREFFTLDGKQVDKLCRTEVYVMKETSDNGAVATSKIIAQ